MVPQKTLPGKLSGKSTDTKQKVEIIPKKSLVNFPVGEGYYNKTLNVYELSFFNYNDVHVYLRILAI